MHVADTSRGDPCPNRCRFTGDQDHDLFVAQGRRVAPTCIGPSARPYSPIRANTALAVLASQGGTATAGSDFLTTPGTLRFEPGELQKTISVEVLADTLTEKVETFNVELCRRLGANLERWHAIGTIQDAHPATRAPRRGGSYSPRR